MPAPEQTALTLTKHTHQTSLCLALIYYLVSHPPNLPGDPARSMRAVSIARSAGYCLDAAGCYSSQNELVLQARRETAA